MKNKKFAVLGILVAILLVVGAIGAGANFFDVERTTNNSFTSGTLDLKINGADAPITLFNATGLRPGSQPTGSFTLSNTGSVPGSLSITNVVVTNAENNRWEPEIESGDTTENIGELQNVLNLRMYIDADKDGYWSTGDVMLFEGLLKNLPSTIPVNKTLATGDVIRVNMVFDWWSTSIDNQAMSDSVSVSMDTVLNQ